ncbi:Serine/threonine-protein phosphatase 1 [compost metagenome]
MVIDCTHKNGDIPRHIRNGGAWFYNLPKPAQENILEELSKLPIMMEIELIGGQKVGVIHAEVPISEKSHGWQEAKNWVTHMIEENQQKTVLQLSLYSRIKIGNQDRTKIKGIDRVYVGHTTVGNITKLGNVTYIDTGCSFEDGALSLLDLNAGAIFTKTMS